MRHNYLRQLSRNVTRGQLAAAKDLRGTGGRAPVGYIQHGDEVTVDPEWAPIIRRTFEAYLEPKGSIRSVAELLNQEGILTVRGKKWALSTVRDVLTNRKYTGAYIRFKYRTGKYHAVKDGEIVTRSRTDEWEELDEPMVVEDHHEAIVDKRTFGRVQRKLAGKRGATAHRTGHQYIFSGLLRCGDCGGAMGRAPATDGWKRKKYPIYRCRTYHQQGPSACHCNSVSEAGLLDVVTRKMQAEIFSETAVDRILRLYRKRLAARRKVVPSDDGRLRKQIEKLDQQIDQGVDRVLSAPEKLVGTIYAKLDRLRTDRDRLQGQLDAAGQPETGSDDQDERKVEEAARGLGDLREAFQDAEPEEIRELISPLVSRIELNFDHEQVGKRWKNPLRNGTIFVKPTDPELSLLFGSSGN